MILLFIDMETNMKTNMEKYKQLINNYFNTIYLPQYPSKIRDALQYLFSDGKRLRPILFLSFSHSIQHSIQHSDLEKNTQLDNSINIELLHCLSLVIDDLPEMDNELLRRDKPCFHIKYGMVKTHFFIYYMLSRIINNFTNIIEYDKIYSSNDSTKNSNIQIRMRLIEDNSYIIRYLINNLIDGQYFDMEYFNLDKPASLNIDKNINIITDLILSILEELNIHTEENNNEIIKYCVLSIKKTGTLFALPIITGLLFQIYYQGFSYTGNEIIESNSNRSDNDSRSNKYFNLGDDNMINLIITWSFLFGFLYQASDDYLDCNDDMKNNKPNISIILGMENCHILIINCVKIISDILEYIIKSSKTIWPSLEIDNTSILEILELIKARIK